MEMKRSKERINFLLNNIPEHCTHLPAFENCTQRMTEDKIAESVVELITVTEEANQFFSHEFWLVLGEIADDLKMNVQSRFCKLQAKKMKKYNIPFGWTLESISSGRSIVYIPQLQIEKWLNERRSGDNILEILQDNGLHLKMHGRSGTLYYVNQGRIIEIDCEYDAYGLAVFVNDISHWSFPEFVSLMPAERTKFIEEINEWAQQSKGNVTIC